MPTATVILGDAQPIGDILEIAIGSTHSLTLGYDDRVFARDSTENGRPGGGTNIDSYYAVNARDGNSNPLSLY